VTRDELTRRILTALNDDPADPVFWSSTEVHDLIAEAMEVVCEETPSLKRTFLVPRRPGWLLYTLPGVGERIMAPYRLWLPDRQQRLEAVSLTDLDGRHEEWMTVTGEPRWWAPVSWDQFVIWPIPAAGGNWIQVDCYVWPDPLQDGEDEPEFHEADHEGLVLYAEHEGHLKQWDVARGSDLFQQFVQRWGDARYRAQVGQVSGRLWQRASHRQRDDGDY
jgi:hypothetical protein